MTALEVACDRDGCRAKPGEPCQPIPSYASFDGMKSYDQELVALVAG